MKFLLDVNVLIAAIWTNHLSHQVADKALAGKKLVTCPLSELGFIRISTHPRGLNSPMLTARKVLKEFVAAHEIEFLSADLPALKSNAAKSDAVTDNYLADLAAAHGMKLATLDQGLKHPAAHLIT